MINAEGNQNGDTRQLHISLLLALIENSERLVAVQNHVGFNITSTTPFINPELIYHCTQSLLKTSEIDIGVLLHDLQGIPYAYTDPVTGVEVPCTLIDWHGTDPAVPGNSIWGIAERPAEFISIGNTALRIGISTQAEPISFIQ